SSASRSQVGEGAANGVGADRIESTRLRVCTPGRADKSVGWIAGSTGRHDRHDSRVRLAVDQARVPGDLLVADVGQLEYGLDDEVALVGATVEKQNFAAALAT